MLLDRRTRPRDSPGRKPMTAWTLGRVLAWAAKDFAGRGLDTPRLDAEILLAHALGLRRLDLYLRHEQPLTDAELSTLRGLVARRRQREPVAYIVGRRDFYGRSFAVDPRVLVPRPETEGLVELALKALPDDGASPSVADLCTGSGCVAVTLAAERPYLSVDAVDLSADALAVARGNADALGVGARVATWEGDLWAPLAGRRFHLVTANPPYIPSPELDGLMPDVRDFEPRMALDGGPDGTALLGRLLADARAHLLPGATIVVELHWDQGPAAVALAEAAGLVDAEATRDWSGHTRYLRARAPTD